MAVAVPPALAGLVKAQAKHFATCWRFARRDGVVIRLTTHDRRLTVDGETYSPVGGFTPSAERKNASTKRFARTRMRCTRRSGSPMPDVAVRPSRFHSSISSRNGAFPGADRSRREALVHSESRSAGRTISASGISETASAPNPAVCIKTAWNPIGNSLSESVPGIAIISACARSANPSSYRRSTRATASPRGA